MEIPYILILIFLTCGNLVGGALSWRLTKVLNAYDEERNYSDYKEAWVLLAIQVGVALLAAVLAGLVSLEVVGIGYMVAGGSAFVGGLMAPFWFKAARDAGKRVISKKAESL
jgi:ABC-type thiamin/hydroxymethylpyrimidine transport system permease subunit